MKINILNQAHDPLPRGHHSHQSTWQMLKIPCVIDELLFVIQQKHEITVIGHEKPMLITQSLLADRTKTDEEILIGGINQ